MADLVYQMRSKLQNLKGTFASKYAIHSFLSDMKCNQTFMPSIICRSFHLSAPVEEGKYHYLKKKRQMRQKRKEDLAARLERLDEEDRPTGCLLCPKRTDVEINYKNVRLLSQFVSPHSGRIYGRKITGLCDWKQKEVAGAIRQARAMGFMPVTMKYLEYHQDPKLF